MKGKGAGNCGGAVGGERGLLHTLHGENQSFEFNLCEGKDLGHFQRGGIL